MFGLRLGLGLGLGLRLRLRLGLRFKYGRVRTLDTIDEAKARADDVVQNIQNFGKWFKGMVRVLVVWENDGLGKVLGLGLE